MSDSVFDTYLQSTSPAFLTSFGRTVTYYPLGGSSRSIQAVIGYKPPANMPGLPAGSGPRFTALVANSNTTGISSTELDTGGDKIGIATRFGEAEVQRRIVGILSQDAGMLYLEIF